MSRRACYPRPDFRRETWMSLNGAWRFSFGDEEKDRMDQPPTLSQMPLTIEVPYLSMRIIGHWPNGIPRRRLVWKNLPTAGLF